MNLVCSLDNIPSKGRLQRIIPLWDSQGLTFTPVIGQLPNVLRFEGLRDVEMLSRGQLGCYQTHLQAWSSFLLSKCDWCLVIEDDAIPLVNSQFKKRLDSLKKQYHKTEFPCFIQIGHVPFSRITSLKLIIALYKFIFKAPKLLRGYTSELSYGTHCYLINRSMASFLIEFSATGILGLDTIFIQLSKSPLAKNFVMKRRIFPLSLQERADSSIPADQEYKGRISNKLTIRERLSCISEL